MKLPPPFGPFILSAIIPALVLLAFAIGWALAALERCGLAGPGGGNPCTHL